jgi:Tol biopolymer transport system component
VSFSVSDNGVLVYQAGFPNAELKWYDRNGNDVGEVGRPSQFWGNVRASRDGRRIAAAIWSPDNGAPGIWTFDASGNDIRRLTFPPEIHRRPVWSPDGKRIAVGRSRILGGPRLAILDVSENGPPEYFETGNQFVVPADWSPDRRFISLDDGIGQEQHDVFIADVSSKETIPLLKSDFAQWGVAFSPDGKQIAFVSTQSGRPEVYVQAFEAAPKPHVVGERRPVSTNGAWLARWGWNSHELFYLGLDNQMNAVPVTGLISFGAPKALFKLAGASQFGTTRDFQFDVSPDGQRFLFPNTGTIPPPPFTVIENWQEKLRR